MANCFDKNRGIKSGRINPSSVSPHEGEKVFVLGADGDTEPAVLTNGDYTEIKQRVDLSGFDFVSANFKTIGTVMGQTERYAGFTPFPAPLFWFDFNVGAQIVENKIKPGFDLVADGSIEVGNETYSPNETYCRTIPEGVGAARMLGENTPQAFPGTLSDYTLQFWLNFNSAAFASSTGITATVFDSDDGTNGLSVHLVGVAASHQWYFLISHVNSGVLDVVPIGIFFIDEPLGWKLFTIRYRSSKAQPEQCQLFVNDLLVGACASDFVVSPGAPSLGADIVYGDDSLIGDVDDIRLLDLALSDAQIEQSYNSCISNPTSIDYRWVMQILFDGVLYGERTIEPSESREWDDFVVPCRIVTGETDISFRLKIEQLA